MARAERGWPIDMTLEQPQRPGQKEEQLQELREELRSLRQDITFLRQLLEHLQEEFARIKGR